MSEHPQPKPQVTTLYKLLAFFFPIHYPIGMELERETLQGKISRKQAAILWFIQNETGGQGHVRRKAIERALDDWFETRNSHVSHLLKELSEPPLSLVEQISNPNSGREKLVGLTPAGVAFFEEMLQQGLSFFSERLNHLSDNELKDGLSFLSKAFGPPTRLPPLGRETDEDNEKE